MPAAPVCLQCWHLTLLQSYVAHYAVQVVEGPDVNPHDDSEEELIQQYAEPNTDDEAEAIAAELEPASSDDEGGLTQRSRASYRGVFLFICTCCGGFLSY